MLNAISLLKEDHQRLSGLFDLFMSSEQLSEKLILFQQIKEEIEDHSLIEEKIFYPALSKFYEFSDRIDACYEELDEMGDIAEEIDQMEPQSEEFSDAVDELRLMFQRHIEEEERGIFPQARGLLDAEDLREMATRMNELRGLSRVA